MSINKTVLTLFSVFIACAVARATTLPVTLFSPAPISGCSDSDATAWKAQVVTNGGTVSAGRLTLVCQMITGLKSDGVWAKLDGLWLLAAENSQSALVDLVARRTATVTNAPTFTTNLGYLSAGSASYIDTGYNFSTNSVQYTRNSGHIMAYVNNSSGVSSNVGIVGTSSAVSFIFPRYTGDVLHARINSSSGSGFTAYTAVGSSIASRTGSTTTVTYKNGSSLGTDATASSAITSANLLILGRNIGVGDTANRYAAVSIGAGLTAGEVSGGSRTTGIDGRVLTYLTAIGAN